MGRLLQHKSWNVSRHLFAHTSVLHNSGDQKKNVTERRVKYPKAVVELITVKAKNWASKPDRFSGFPITAGYVFNPLWILPILVSIKEVKMPVISFSLP